jgi:hypothetical protein
LGVTDIPSPVRKRVKNLITASQANTTELIHLKRDLARTDLAQQTKRIEKAQKNSQLQSGGVLTVSDGRRIVQRKVENEELKAIALVEGIQKKKTQMRKKWAEEVAKEARKWRNTKKLEPFYIVDGIGNGRYLVRA